MSQCKTWDWVYDTDGLTEAEVGPRLVVVVEAVAEGWGFQPSKSTNPRRAECRNGWTDK